MAAPMESIAFCNIWNETAVIGVSKGHTDDSIVVTNKEKSINVYKISDQKLLKSWSLKHGTTVTSPVLWDQSNQRFICVTNHLNVHSWSSDTADFDKSKKKHSKTRIHELMLAPDFDGILLFENGCVDFLANIKADHTSGRLQAGEKITWCRAAVLESKLHVVYITTSAQADSNSLYVCCYDVNGGQWRSKSASLDTPGQRLTLSSVDCTVTEKDMNIVLYWSEGKLSNVNVCEGNIGTLDFTPAIPSLHGDLAIATLDDLHLAVTPINRDKQAGVCVFDVKFGLQKLWQPFTESPQVKPRIFRVGERLFIPSHTTLYMHQFEVRPSTVVSVLGHRVDAPQVVPAHYHWHVNNKTDATPASKLPDHIAKASDTTLTYSKFKTAFSSVFAELTKEKHRHWPASGHMTALVKCMLGEFNFWPKKELEKLMSIKAIPQCLLVELVSALVKKSEVGMIYQTLSSFSNIPEKGLCTAVAFFLECEEEKLLSLSELGDGSQSSDDQHRRTDGPADMDVEEPNGWTGDTETEEPASVRCPISGERAQLVNMVLCQPYSDVFLLESLRNVSFKSALKLLEYLIYLLETESALNNNKHQVQLIQVVDWLCLVLDAHITQFVLSPDCHMTILKLKSIVTEQAQFYDHLVALEALLEQFKARNSLPKEEKIGHYCIEVLHVM